VSLGRTGERFLREFATTEPDGVIPSGSYIPEAAQTAEALLEAIERLDGTRSSVTRELLRLNNDKRNLGTYRYSANSDMTTQAITVFRVTGEKGADAPRPSVAPTSTASCACLQRSLVPK
jgi:hypothetical protein